MIIRGLNKEKLKNISRLKDEDSWVLNYRLESLKYFESLPQPHFGPQVDIDFKDIIYYKNENKRIAKSWCEVNPEIHKSFENLGVLNSEKKMSGIGVQYESETIYSNMLKELEEKNVIFTTIEEGLKKYSHIAKKYFGKIIKNDEHLYSALNSAAFSGGAFIYVPPHTKLSRPLQSYFRIETENLGQFERTLIIVDDDSSLEYIEGCTAPLYSNTSLHAANVEIYVGKNSKMRFITMQNWSKNVINMVTERALVEENGEMTWIDGNVGSKISMKYPSCILKGDNSLGRSITFGVAMKGQIQEGGSNMIHLGKNTRSELISKSIAKEGGSASYRGKTIIKSKALNSEAFLKCDSLILDENSISNAYPKNIIENNTSFIEHEALVEHISKDNLFYLMSKGLTKEQASELIIIGFLDDFTKYLPIEYSVELNQLLKSLKF